MPGRRYPRPGHRLAPRTLALVLEKALPPECAVEDADAPQRLCDLDESAWDRFDEETCRLLASEVVRVVGRAARQPSAFSGRAMPPIPSGVSLAELELEPRTFNCLVAAGIQDRPQDLARMTIEGVLSLQGFWGKCLVDLLTSIEHAADHPESRRARRGQRAVPERIRKPLGRYPRRGYRLAPATLREILQVPVPAHRIKNPAVRGLQLCDLDEEISAQLTDAELAALGRMIIARVNVSGQKRALGQCAVPQPPKGMRLQELALENRTYNCLVREGFGARLEDLAKCSVGDLLGFRAFGAKCLLDLLSSLETALARSERLDESLTQEAIALGEMPEAAIIHFSDPRLGALLRGVDSEADTLGQLAERIVKRRVDPADLPDCRRRLAEIRRRIGQFKGLSIGEELASIFAGRAQSRDRAIVAEHFGWDGRGNRTLEELGNRHGLSRERIRQICVRAAKRHCSARVFAPVLDRVIGFIAARLPIAAGALRREFAAAGLDADWLPPRVIRQAAQFLSRPVPFDTVMLERIELVVEEGSLHAPKVIAQAARRIALASGIATTADVARQAAAQLGSEVDPALVRVALETLADFQWLDRRQTWFHLESGSQYGLPNMIEKVLAVCPRIDGARLRAALGRRQRSGRRVPPERVLFAFCAQMPGVAVENRTVVASRPRKVEEVLSGIEAAMVAVLQSRGPVMERGAFEEVCLNQGINRFSFNAILMSSPVICQLGRSIYGLVGSAVNRRKVRAMVARRQGAAPDRVLRGAGKLDDGRLFLSYKLSKAAIAGGVTTVPAAMKADLAGRFTIRTVDGAEVGQLVARDGCAWGLGPALRSLHARPGDHMVLLLDNEAKRAEVYLGEQDLLDTLVESLSLQTVAGSRRRSTIGGGVAARDSQVTAESRRLTADG